MSFNERELTVPAIQISLHSVQNVQFIACLFLLMTAESKLFTVLLIYYYF